MAGRPKLDRRRSAIKLIDLEEDKTYDGPYCRVEGCGIIGLHAPHATAPSDARKSSE